MQTRVDYFHFLVTLLPTFNVVTYKTLVSPDIALRKSSALCNDHDFKSFGNIQFQYSVSSNELKPGPRIVSWQPFVHALKNIEFVGRARSTDLYITIAIDLYIDHNKRSVLRRQSRDTNRNTKRSVYCQYG